MLCLNVPKKVTSLISVWGSMLLILIAALLCFQPMFTLHVDTKTLDDIDDMLAEMEADDISISDFVAEDNIEIDVSIVDLASGASLLVQMLSAIGDENADVAAEIEALLDTEEGKKSVLMLTAIAVTMMNAIDVEAIDEDIDNIEDAVEDGRDQIEGIVGDVDSEEDLENIEGEIDSVVGETESEIADAAKDLADNIFMIVLKMLIILIALLVVLGLTVIVPIRACFSALTALIVALVNVKNPEKASPKLAKRLPSLLTMPLLLILFSCLVPELGVGSGAMGVLIVCFVSVLLAVVLSRLHSYTPAQMKYANVMQGISLVGLIGYLVFFFNVINVGAFGSFVNGKLSSHIMNVITAQLEEKTVSAGASTGYVLDVVMILVAVLFVLISRGYLASCLRRLSCAISVKEGKSSIKDIILPRAILMLPIFVLPTLVMNSNNYFADVTADEGTASLLVLNAEQQSAFDGVLAGIIIVLVAEIAMIVLRAALCHDVSAEDKGLVMSGAATAEIAAPVADAPAEDVAAMAEAPEAEEAVEAPTEEAVEAVAEEAPAEEAVEAPAEETPAEEVPAEEAPEAVAEEAPAEETVEAPEEATEEKTEE